MTEIRIPALNNLKVKLDLSKLDDEGTYDIHYDDTAGYTDEEITKAVSEFVENLLKSAISDYEATKDES